MNGRPLPCSTVADCLMVVEDVVAICKHDLVCRQT
jgi:hypothetical protein